MSGWPSFSLFILQIIVEGEGGGGGERWQVWSLNVESIFDDHKLRLTIESF